MSAGVPRVERISPAVPAADGFDTTADVLAFVAHQLRSLVSRYARSPADSGDSGDPADRGDDLNDGPSDDPRFRAFITVPAPRAAKNTLPLRVLMDDGDGSEHVMVWTPPRGTRHVGVDAALVLTGSGPSRVDQIEQAAQAAWPTLAQVTYPGVAPLTPRFFGGFAFSEGAASNEPWSAFGDARFVLPTWLYTDGDADDADNADDTGHTDNTGQGARLALCIPLLRAGHADATDALIESWIAERVAELERVLGHLAPPEPERRSTTTTTTTTTPPATPPELLASHESTGPAEWRRQVQDITRAIAEGHCDKIVAARCRQIELSHSVGTARVLDNLDRRYPDCHRFAFSFERFEVFVGASPERLIARSGERISTQALAGSIAAGIGPERDRAAAALLASRKDRGEQDFVVQAIRCALEPLCVRLDIPEQPVIRELHDVLHLETPIEGHLRQPVHILELLARLHPTPAVGGVPTDSAVSWITDNEPTPRGWYASPVGFFDVHGQGEFVVAIRSGLLRRSEAFIYVGAGIVHDSDPDAELAETRLKERALLSALELEP